LRHKKNEKKDKKTIKHKKIIMKTKQNNLVKLILLLLMLTGVTGLQAQVRIGGSVSPNTNAILDLNANDTAVGSKGLLLPRVALVSTTNPSPLTAHVQAMLVYNTVTAGDVLPGVYYNDGTKWIRGIEETTSVPIPPSLKETEIAIGEVISTQSILYRGDISDVGPNTTIVNIKGVFSDPEMANNSFTITPTIKMNEDNTTIHWSLQIQNFNFNPELNSRLERIIIVYQTLNGEELTMEYRGSISLVGW